MALTLLPPPPPRRPGSDSREARGGPVRGLLATTRTARPSRRHPPASAGIQPIRARLRRQVLKDLETVRFVRVTSFGTRGSQVQILPLRPTLSSTRNVNPDSFPDRYAPSGLLCSM